MYLDFFKLREYPFALTPDSDFWFDAASHRDAMNVVGATLRGGEGFIKITAEIGLGKTLLCRKLLRDLEGEFHTAYIPDPQLSPNGLKRALAEELGRTTPCNLAADRLLSIIRARLLELAARQTRVVLLIDEAHQLPDRTLEALRLLTNLETEKFKLLQVVILGQPELDRRLERPHLRQLRQRITFSCTLSAMSVEVATDYIAHRLGVADCRSNLRFDQNAVRLIVSASEGTPRLINVLCHKSLMAAFGRGEQRITAVHARRAIEDTESVARIRPGALVSMRAWLAGHPERATKLAAPHGVFR